MNLLMWGAAPHVRRHRHVAVALAAAACFGAAPSSAGAQAAEGTTTAKVPSALWAVQVSRRVSAGLKAANVRAWRKGGINAVVVDVRQLGPKPAARTRQLIRKGGLAYVPIVASARKLSAAGKLRAACRAARRTAPAQSCAVAASSPALARALANRAVADFVVVRVTKPSALLKLRGKPSRSRIVAIVALKPGRFSTAAWESAIEVAKADAGVDLGVAPLGTKPLRTLDPYLDTLTRSLRAPVTSAVKMTPPSGLRLVHATSSSVTLAWDAAAGGAATISYDVYRDGAKVATTQSPTARVDGLYCGQSYRFGVEAVDGSGSRSDRVELAAAAGACVGGGGGGGSGGGGGGGGDSTPPTTPGSFATTGRTTSNIALSWTASTDDVGVVGYGVYQGGTLVGSTAGTTYTVTGLACGTSYSLAVDAYDAAGNPSARATLTTSTSSCPADTQAPTTPTNLARTGSTTTSISVSWTASTDNVGVTGYGRYRNGSLVSSGSGTSYTFSGLSCGTSYTLGVDAYDAAGNRSGQASISASTSACSPPPPPGCPVLLTPTPVPGYCTGRVISISPSTFGSGVFGSGGISVSPGDVVVFEDGTYTDSDGDGAVLRIKASGTSSAWITFVSRTKWGAHMWGDDNDAAEGISLDGADYVRVEGFEVSDVGNVGSPRGSSSGIDLYNGGKHSQIVANHIHHVGRVCANPDNTNGQVGIFVQTGKNGGSIVVENNLIHDIGRFFVGENGCGNTTVSLDHGMYLNGGSGGGGGAGNVTIRNNVFHDTHHGWGVQWYPGSLDNIHVLNNTFAFCNESKSYTCIVLDATISNSTIKNNVFYNPQGGKTIEAAGFSGAITVGNNLTSGNAMHDRGSTPSGMSLVANVLSTSAQLVNPPFDFHLTSGSPAIDRGERLSSVAIDHDGRSRPAGSSHDIGAFEYGG